MTEDYNYEFNYLYHERIGMMCGSNEPTIDQKNFAFTEAERLTQKHLNHPNPESHIQ